jgi:uncharacterized protein (DUF433 family)
MDWSDCPLVEVKAGVQRGRPVPRGSRMPVDDIVENWEAGVDEPEIAANFRLPVEQVKQFSCGRRSAGMLRALFDKSVPCLATPLDLLSGAAKVAENGHTFHRLMKKSPQTSPLTRFCERLASLLN